MDTEKIIQSGHSQYESKVEVVMSEIISGITLVKWPDGKVCKHPSDFFKRNYLNRAGTMTNEAVSESLGVTPKFLSSFLNEEVIIDPSFAVKLAESTGFCEGTWLELQRKYDLWLCSP
jgi:addiction module HigA family antidote